jgi:hypothetical protein
MNFLTRQTAHVTRQTADFITHFNELDIFLRVLLQRLLLLRLVIVYLLYSL